MDEIKDGIYWISIKNCCPCSHCIKNPYTKVELARYSGRIWELFGTDVGISRYEEVTILREADGEVVNG